MRILFVILLSLLDIVPGGKAFLEALQPRDSILIADQMEYGFRIEDVEEGTGLALQDFSQFSNDTLTLVRNWQIDTLSKRKGKMSIRGSIRLAAFEEGSYELPAIAVRRVMPDGKVDTLLFEAAVMEVKTMPVDTATFQIHDIKGQMRYPVTFKEILPWGAAVILLALAIFFIIKLIMRKREYADDASHKESAYIVALKRLDKYRGDKYWAPDKQKIYYSGITDTLKFYIEDRFGVDAPEMTTAELFAALKDSKDISPDLFNETRRLFETADFVKFAKHAASDEENANALPLAVRFVTSTYQTELEEEQHKDVL